MATSESHPTPPFPPSGGFIRAIRDTCHQLREASSVSIERSSIERFLTSPSFVGTFKRVSKSHGLAFPLIFPSVVAELNFLAVLSLLNFASGYRVPLHEQTGRGAWDNIRALVFAMYLTSSTERDLLSTQCMKTIGEQNIAELMQVTVHVERPHETIPGVTVGELGGPIHQLVKLISSTLNETGEVLDGMGYPNLGSFILEALKKGESVGAAKGTDTDADTVLEQIVRAIPAFRDMAIVNDQPVYVFKKALFLLHAITIRFGSAEPPPIPIPNTCSLPVFSDNVLPSILIHLGVIDISHSSSLHGVFSNVSINLETLLATAAIDDTHSAVITKLPAQPPSEGPILTQAQAYILRASAIDACDMIVEVARSLGPSVFTAANLSPEDSHWIKEITSPELDMWLWAGAKDRLDYRRLGRFVSRDTVMF